MDNEQKEGAQAHWVVIDHIDRRVNPLSDRLIALEVERRHLSERMTSLENHFKEHMEKSESHLRNLGEEMKTLSKNVSRAVWLGTGGVSVLAFLWLFGRQVFDIWLKVNGG